MQGYKIQNSCLLVTNSVQVVFSPSEPFIVLQEDMRLVINQQVQQKEVERQNAKERQSTGLQRSKSLKVKGEAGKGFFSFFKEKK